MSAKRKTDADTRDRRKVGSYRKRGEASYQLRYKGEWTTVVAADDTEAEKALAAFITDVDKGRFKKPSKMTVKQLSERFLRDYPELSEPTKENYKVQLNNYILPVFEDLKIDKVKPMHIYDFLNNLKEDGIRKDHKPGGLAPAAIQKIFHILSSMFSFAVELGEIKENPCSRVKPPKIPKRKKAGIDRDPARDLLRALAKESLKYRCIVLLGACTGMRRGEICGVGDGTLDLDNCTVNVNRAAKHTQGRIFFDDPKTETGIRVIPFPPALVPLLKEMIIARDKQREKCGDKWVEQIEVHGEMVANDLLFTQWNGKPMHPNTIDTWFRKFKEENGLPESLKFHGLRHTNITLLLKSGIDVGTVADNAGHAQKTTTLAYDDPDAEALRKVADKITNVLDLENIVPNLLNKPVNIYRKGDRAAISK